ncbi:hypothetical protein FA15DRAFT_662512 [Coprinopsis marcescibilis]|uniref:Uncharacterized protein n=1 Tax=Coprinopsis marcescibilis TaxID=230819 RepID=A0A5C3LBU2_COPMA|nr:hypothetical protein FA15DRAFT_662512 [Coprinopsis marcescibilis]
MSESRVPLGPSLSFSANSANSASSIVAKLAKRRISSTSALEFFAPAAKSFQPLPYTPHAPYGQSDGRSKSFPTRQQSRSHDSLAIPGMDPQPNDPDVVFLHPPFNDFPNSHQHPEGISYQVMADNPEWFLDPNDFASATNNSTTAIPYPNILEPPRGWCPAKKKDLKDRGSEGWPEGEEPRLRCTFCRRTYAGVNAKSMWRRHVYEKHKIAMSNRRDGNDRPRGRGSGKENKQSEPSRSREEPHDQILSLQVAPQTEPENTSHKSRFRSTMKPTITIKPDSARKAQVSHSEASSSATQIEDLPTEDVPELKRPTSDGPHPTPPTSPQPPLTSDHDDSKVIDHEPTLSPRAVVPASPYDPSVTPSFRHSPARLPSDQPWRFGSPSHPLHSATRNFSLTMLVREATTPSIKPTGLDSSPFMFRSSPTSTPNDVYSDELKTPSTSAIRTRGFPRSWLVRGPLGSPLEKHTRRLSRDFSPLTHGRKSGSMHKRTPSRLDDWFPSDLDFSLQPPWPAVFVNDGSPSKRTRPSIEPESPVVRRDTSAPIPLGIGLLDPFTLSEDPLSDDIEAEINEIVELDKKRDALNSSAKQRAPEASHECSPPPKKRRLSLKG